MSVLIRGIEMPTSCSRCPMLEGDRMDGLCHTASKWLDDDEYWTWYVYPEGDMDDSKPCNCPLVLVPSHGRLIDADAMCDGLALYNPIVIYAECMPTIIPAEESET